MIKSFLFASLLLASAWSSAQTSDTAYHKQWDLIDSLIFKKSLTRTALDKVNSIYKLAKSKGQQVQVAKTLLYRMYLEERHEEPNINKEIIALEAEVNATKDAATKAIISSLIAQKYNQYFNNYRWKLYQRTNTVNFNKEDIETWSADDFHKAITTWYLQSLQDAAALKNAPIDNYRPILTYYNTKVYRPTLYDLLAHRAIQYFMSDETYINRPAYEFKINDPAALAGIETFIQHPFTTKDSLSNKWKALLLYQDLVRFHTEHKDTAALIDVNLQRLQFAKSNAIIAGSDSLYYDAVKENAERFKNNRYAAQAWFLLASWHAERAAKYNPIADTSYRWEYLKALDICNMFLPLKDSTEGHYNIFNLYNSILSKQLNLTTEQVNVPSLPFRTLVQYRNIPNLYYRVIKSTKATDEAFANAAQQDWKSQFTVAAGLTYLSQQQVSLPATNDYQTHTVEVKIDALPPGKYLLLSSSSSNFSDTAKLTLSRFYVSNISYVNNGPNYFVLDRTTGQPLKNAAVQVWENTYNQQKREYENRKTDNYTTNQDGYFQLSIPKNNSRNVSLQIKYAGDELFMDNQQYLYPLIYSTSDDEPYKNEQEYEAIHSQAFFFTDRSIYRPGQTVYFKMIALTKDRATKKTKLITKLDKDDYYIRLNDVNGKQADSILIRLNEYGSFAGSFKLPVNALTGNFSLVADFFNQSPGGQFSVEEYKRPTFYVELEKPKGTYRLNDSVTVTGTAKAYSGATVDGANIKYRVTRRGRFIYPWLWRRGYFPSSANTTITFGEAVTDAQGKFIITFKTLPDESIAKDLLPIFDFQVNADVTDRAGETRSSSTNVSVGYRSLNLKLTAKETAEADSFKNIVVSTTNSAGDKQPAIVKLNIYKLLTPAQLVRKRYWLQPDQFIYTQEEYKKLFPHDEYKNETDNTTWDKGTSVFSTIVNTKDTNTIDIPKGTLQTGWYYIEATATDKDGHEIKDVKYVQLYSRNEAKFNGADYLFTINNNSNITSPATPVSFLIGSSASDVYVIEEVQHRPKPKTIEVQSEFLFHHLSNEVKEITVTPTVEDIGGLGINFVFVKDNRVYLNNQALQVQNDADDLKVEVLTFRDKIEPGNTETWTVKVSGKNNEAVAAEVLTSMYDASLDQFRPHTWQPPFETPPQFYGGGWGSNENFTVARSEENYIEIPSKGYDKQYPDIDIYLQRQNNKANGVAYEERMELRDALGEASGAPAPQMARAGGRIAEAEVRRDISTVTVKGNSKPNQWANSEKDKAAATELEEPKDNERPNVSVRTNFNEAAFFFPQLTTGKDGSLSFTFTLPDALTQWKWQILAHDKLARFGINQKTVVSQKTLMVQANAPRFMREGDRMEFSAKVSNLSDKELKGSATLELLDALTLEPVDALLGNTTPQQSFTASANQGTAVKFNIAIPATFTRPLTWRIIAKAGAFADGEENTLPVLTNRMLVTESLPLYVRNTPFKRFEFTKLKTQQSTTLQHQSLTVEYTSNPVWYALQSLPYLLEYPYECSEQVFNRFFANALASKIMNSNPNIRQVFEQWKKDTSALKSNLQKNEELKSILIQETPWLLQAESEEQQKKNLALLLDAATIEKSSEAIVNKLQQMQMGSGGFPWFPGGREDRYITQYIITGIGRLQHMQAIPAGQKAALMNIASKAMTYLDEEITKDYKNLQKYHSDLKANNTGPVQLQYLYMKSFFSNPTAAKDKEAYNYFYAQAKKFWIQQGYYFRAMIGEFLYRNNDQAFVNQNILPALMENAVISEDAGMYWKGNEYGWFWYHAPVEQQALMIEFVSEVYQQEKKDYLLQRINDMKTWLLRQKQTNHWGTTKATADACYALLMNGSDWLGSERKAEVKLGDYVVSEVTADGGMQVLKATEAGTGYYKARIDGSKVTPAMGDITVTMTNASGTQATSPSWGAVYWQYFEDLDKITSAATPLLINKKLFTEKNTDRGIVLEPVNDGDKMKVGDKAKIRIEIKVDRDMEYVHLKDMRAASMEPVNVLSSYKWQDGLGYYESTRDASTNFFISYLPKGTYVFEYPVTITHNGNFSVGIATAQCMYAPEFNSHSGGIRINVEQ